MRAALAAFALAVAGEAFACGHCVEDKVAAVYDHAAVTRAISEGRVVVFCALLDAPAGAESRHRLPGLAESVRGVERGSVRVSYEYGALAFAYDPARASLAAVMRGLETRFAAAGAKLLPMRMTSRAGELKAVP